jgi:hypothetical protein
MGGSSIIPGFGSLSDLFTNWATNNPDNPTVLSIVNAGDTVGAAANSIGQSALDVVTSLDSGTSSLWSNVEPWLIALGVLIGLFLIVTLVNDVKAI